MGGESIRGEFGLLSLQARGQNCFGIPEKGAECKTWHNGEDRFALQTSMVSIAASLISVRKLGFQYS